MRRLFSLSLLIALAGIALAQSRPGTFTLIPRVGVTIANVSDNKLYLERADVALDSKAKAGFAVGLDAYYQATLQVGVSAGLYYTSLGNKYDDYDLLRETPSETDVKIKYTSYADNSHTLNYLAVPVLAHVYVARGLAVKAGVQLGMLTGVKRQYTTRDFIMDRQTGERTYAEQSEEYKNTSKDGYKKTDLSIPIGMSYEYMNVVLDARYNLGLTKLQDFTNSKNRFFTLTVGYRFDL